jgi:hypothetical protein
VGIIPHRIAQSITLITGAILFTVRTAHSVAGPTSRLLMSLRSFAKELIAQ